MEIKRFSFDPHGPYVLYSDYQKLEAMLASAQQEIMMYDRLVDQAHEERHGASGLCCQMRLQEKNRADALRQVASELRELAIHVPACPANEGHECDCGLTEVLAKYDALEGKSERYN